MEQTSLFALYMGQQIRNKKGVSVLDTHTMSEVDSTTKLLLRNIKTVTDMELIHIAQLAVHNNNISNVHVDRQGYDYVHFLSDDIQYTLVLTTETVPILLCDDVNKDDYIDIEPITQYLVYKGFDIPLPQLEGKRPSQVGYAIVQ